MSNDKIVNVKTQGKRLTGPVAHGAKVFVWAPKCWACCGSVLNIPEGASSSLHEHSMKIICPSASFLDLLNLEDTASTDECVSQPVQTNLCRQWIKSARHLSRVNAVGLLSPVDRIGWWVPCRCLG